MRPLYRRAFAGRRDERVEGFVAAVGGIGSGAAGRVVDVVGRKEAEQFANHGETIGIIGAMKWATPLVAL